MKRNWMAILVVAAGLQTAAFAQQPGPALSIDANANQHPISPDVYGITATASVYCECPSQSGRFSCSSVNNCADKRAYVEVDTSATFHTLIKYPGIPDSVPISGQAIMRVE